MSSNSKLNEEELAAFIAEAEEIERKMAIMKDRKKVIADRLDLHYGFSLTTAGSKTYGKKIQFKRNVVENPDHVRIRLFLEKHGIKEKDIEKVLKPQPPKFSKSAASELPTELQKDVMKMVSKTETSISMKVIINE